MPRTFAQITAQADEIPAPAERERPISPRLAKVLHLLITGEAKTCRAACGRVGMSPSYLSTALRTAKVRVFVERRCRETIAAGQMRASARLLELLDASSEHVALDATKHTLAIGGIAPARDPQISVNLTASIGYVIDLSGDSDRRDQRGPVIEAQPPHK